MALTPMRRAAPAGGALRGRFVSERLRGGLALHGALIETDGRVANASTVDAGLKLIVMLDGRMRIACAEARVDLGPSQCAWLSLREAARVERCIEAGGPLRQVVLTIEPCWLADAGLDGLPGFEPVARLRERHGAVATLADGARIAAAARSLLAPDAAAPAVRRLRREALALETLVEALQALTPARTTATPPTAGDRRRADALTGMLHAGECDDWTVAQMARHLATNPTSLQRAFRERHGCAVAQYLRTLKLERAHAALRRGDRVIDAAAAAGYDNPANFATAFRRRYGLAPSALRRRIG